MKWIYLECGDAYNVSNLAHIWVQKCPSGYFLMGEMIHNQEEVALSHIVDSYDQCVNFIRKISMDNQPERLSEKTYYRNEDGTYPHLESCVGSDSLNSMET